MALAFLYKIETQEVKHLSETSFCGSKEKVVPWQHKIVVKVQQMYVV